MPGAGGSGTQWKPGEHRPGRPATRPGQGGSGTQWKPGERLPIVRPGEGGSGTQWKPGERHPNHPDLLPGRPGGGGSGTQWRPDHHRPNPPWKPGGGGGGTQWHPADHRPHHPDRPPRPPRPNKWQNIHDNNVNQWNQWKQTNNVNIQNFQANRVNNWNNIDRRWNERGWASRFGSGDYSNWRNNVLDFRKDRCEEIWDRREDFWDDVFDDHWWGSCWWRPRPIVALDVNTSPWWWWQPASYSSYTQFYGSSVPAQPVTYDPGTSVIYEGDTVYVNGQNVGAATDYRQQVAQLATPAVEETPVPEPPAAGQPAAWLPLGVWALTQQEQGDANMFFQLSSDKNGIVAGAFKNVMTGEEEPVVGQIDQAKQRVAWHVGDVTETVYETGLSSLTKDVASVFVHFGDQKTQTWLLVRLSSPEIPPGPVSQP